MTREQELKKAGWTKQSTHDEPRLSHIVEMYEEIGLEVLLVPFNADQAEGCIACLRGASRDYKTIYTKPKQ